MDKLQQLYESFLRNNLISNDTDFNTFSSASQEQLRSLYDVAINKKVLSAKTNFDTFSSAWSVKKKDELQPTSQEDVTVSTTKEEETPTSLESSEDKFDYEKFLDKDEEEAIYELQKKLTGKGYSIEETGIGNALLVTDNITGEQTEIDLKPIEFFKGTRFAGDTNKRAEEIDKIKNLIETPSDSKRALLSANKIESFYYSIGDNDIENDSFVSDLKNTYSNFDFELYYDPTRNGKVLRASKGDVVNEFELQNYNEPPEKTFSKINKFLYDNITEEEASEINNIKKVDELKRLEKDLNNIDNTVDISMESAEAGFYNENYFKGLFGALERAGVSVPQEAKTELEGGVKIDGYDPKLDKMITSEFDKNDIENGVQKYFGSDPEIMEKINQYNLAGTINVRKQKIQRAKKLATEVYYENRPDRESAKEFVLQSQKDLNEEELEITTNVEMFKNDLQKLIDGVDIELDEISKKNPGVKIEKIVDDEGVLQDIISSEPIEDLELLKNRINNTLTSYITLVSKSKYDLDKINSKKETTDQFIEAADRNYNLVDTALADLKNATIQLGGGLAIVETLAEGAIEDVTGTPVSLGGGLPISSDVKMDMIRSDMAESREKVEKFYKTKRTYNEAISEGSKLEFGARTIAEQTPNVVLAIGTSGAGSSIGLSEAAVSTLIATQFGITSAGQKYDELTTRQEFRKIAEQGLKELESIKDFISEDDYLTQKYELERAIKDSNISATDKTLSVIGTGIIEGTVARIFGTAPNSIKILKDMKSPVNFMDDILRSNYKATVQAVKEFGKRTGGEILEETSIDLLTQINDYAFLGDQIDLSSLDDVAVTSIITSGAMNTPSTAYSTILTQINVNRYKNKINSLTGEIVNLKEMLMDSDLTDTQRSSIHDIINNLTSDIASETTNMEGDALLLGSENIKNLLTLSGIRQSMLKKADVENDDSYEVANAKIDNYLKGLDKDAAKKFTEKMKYVDDSRNKIIDAIDYEGAVEKVFGEKGTKIAEGLDDKLTPQQKYVEVYKQIRQEINTNAKKEFDAIQEQKTGGVPDANPVVSKGVKVKSAPGGTYIDVEMIAGKDGRKLSPEEVLDAIPVDGIEFDNDGNNLRIKLPRELTPTEMMSLMKATEQEAIGQIHNGVGKLYAQSKKLLEDYGNEFNENYFKLPREGKLKKYNAIQETEAKVEGEVQESGIDKLRGAFSQKQKPSIEDVVKESYNLEVSNVDTNKFLSELDYTKEEIAQFRENEEGMYKKTGNKVLDWLKKTKIYLTSARAFLPKNVFIAKENKDSAISTEISVAERAAKRLNKALKNQPNSVYDEVNKLMKGERFDLPKNIAILAKEMREHIDSLSQKLIDSGAVKSSDSMDNIRKNLGSYLNRSFRVFDDKNWSKKVSEKVVNQAKEYIKNSWYQNEYKLEQAKIEAENDNMTVDEWIDKKSEQEVNEILNKEDANSFVKSAIEGSKNIKVLKQRKDIPAEILALMGEYNDPSYNYVMSVAKIVNIVENQKYLEKIKDIGEGVFLFKEEQLKRGDSTNYVQISAESNESLAPLNGYYAPKEFVDQMRRENLIDIKDSWFKIIYKGWLKSVGSVKKLKTIYSLGTHGKNVFGNARFMAQNGYLNPKDYNNAYELLRNEFRNNGDEALSRKLDEYRRAGVINQNIGLNEIKSMFSGDDSFDVRIEKRTTKQTESKFKKAGKKVDQFLEDLYQAEDDLFKIVAYENEKRDYADIMFDKPYEDLTDSEKKKVDDRVSNIVKNILPNYSRLGGLARGIKYIPVTGTFISFQLEAYRTAWNTVNLALNEIKSDNSKLRSKGSKRLASLIFVEGIKQSLLYFLGTSFLGDDDEEKIKANDVRPFLPEWAKNSDILVTNNEPGKFTYLNLSSSDPYGGIFQIINAASRGESFSESVTGMLKEFGDPVLSQDIFLSSIDDIIRNKNNYGGNLYEDSDTFFEKSGKTLERLYKAFEPGTLTSIRKIAKKKSASGMFYETIGQITGVKPIDVDVSMIMNYKIKDAKESIDNIKKQEYRAEYRAIEENSIGDLFDVYKEVDEKLLPVYEKYNNTINKAMRLGVPITDIDKMMSSKRFSNDDASMMLFYDSFKSSLED